MNFHYMHTSLLHLAFLVGCLCISLPSHSATPVFEQYPVAITSTGAAASIDLTSHKLAKRYRTVLTQGARKGPNFAGHYTIVTWGCGTACQELAIVDAKNGKVYFPPNLRLNAYQDVHIEFKALDYLLQSSLLVIAGSPNDREPLGLHYYLWQNNTLKKIHEIPRSFLPENTDSL